MTIDSLESNSRVQPDIGSISMTLSLEFKRAIASAAITRLNAGSRNLNAAAKWVSERVGDNIYTDHKGVAKAAILLDYRKKILGSAKGKVKSGRIAVARYHYEQCLNWVSKEGLKPEESARLLIQTMLEHR